MREASGALQAAEDKAFHMGQELQAIKENCDADIQHAVSRAVSQYQLQLTMAQLHTQGHQVAITQLKEQICVIELSLASCGDLPSVGQTEDGVDLQD